MTWPVFIYLLFIININLSKLENDDKESHNDDEKDEYEDDLENKYEDENKQISRRKT